MISLTSELALEQAERADREIAAGRYRGPLHGVPWGAKDLLAVPGYRTTWGARPYEDQVIDETATVVRRLEDAGAVLVAKLILGALAWGDVWYGGKTRNLFEEDRAAKAEDADDEQKARIREWQDFDRRSLEVLRSLGIELVPISLPDNYSVDALSVILTAEAACAFDELTRSGRDDLLVRQVKRAWPNSFRQGQTVPAVEYLRANRIRTLVMREMEEKLAGVDAYVTPTFAGDHLLLTNLTGHPCVVVPNGFRGSDGTPTSITFMGRLDGETEVLALAHAYQQATDFHLRRPPLVL